MQRVERSGTVADGWTSGSEPTCEWSEGGANRSLQGGFVAYVEALAYYTKQPLKTAAATAEATHKDR